MTEIFKSLARARMEGRASPGVRTPAMIWALSGFLYTVAGKGCFVAEKNLDLIREQQLKELENHLTGWRAGPPPGSGPRR